MYTNIHAHSGRRRVPLAGWKPPPSSHPQTLLQIKRLPDFAAVSLSGETWLLPLFHDHYNTWSDFSCENATASPPWCLRSILYGSKTGNILFLCSLCARLLLLFLWVFLIVWNIFFLTILWSPSHPLIVCFSTSCSLGSISWPIRRSPTILFFSHLAFFRQCAIFWSRSYFINSFNLTSTFVSDALY